MRWHCLAVSWLAWGCPAAWGEVREVAAEVDPGARVWTMEKVAPATRVSRSWWIGAVGNRHSRPREYPLGKAFNRNRGDSTDCTLYSTGLIPDYLLVVHSTGREREGKTRSRPPVAWIWSRR